MTKNAFVTIAKYQYSSEAQIAKGRLEADGIDVFLADNLTIDTCLLYTSPSPRD